MEKLQFWNTYNHQLSFPLRSNLAKIRIQHRRHVRIVRWNMLIRGKRSSTTLAQNAVSRHADEPRLAVHGIVVTSVAKFTKSKIPTSEFRCASWCKMTVNWWQSSRNPYEHYVHRYRRNGVDTMRIIIKNRFSTRCNRFHRVAYRAVKTISVFWRFGVDFKRWRRDQRLVRLVIFALIIRFEGLKCILCIRVLNAVTLRLISKVFSLLGFMCKAFFVLFRSRIFHFSMHIVFKEAHFVFLLGSVLTTFFTLAIFLQVMLAVIYFMLRSN